jgi:predicted amidohydrolase YtcJ
MHTYGATIWLFYIESPKPLLALRRSPMPIGKCFVTLCLAGLATGAMGQTPVPAPADLMFYGGKVLTVDSGFSIQSALVVKDGRILAVGGEETRELYRATKSIDLKGRVLMPGFTDTHIHVQAASPRSIELEGVRSIAEIQDRLRKKTAELGHGQWITGYGWDEAQLAERRNITRTDLDAASPDNPVVLTRAGSHSAVGNSLALKLAGLDRHSPDPDKGLLERDAQGELNGIIRERIDLFSSKVPRDSWETLRGGYVKALQRLFSLGITSIIEATGSIDDEPADRGGLRGEGPGTFGTRLTLRRLQELRREHDLPRVALYISYPGRQRLEAYPYHTGYGDEWDRIGPIGESAVDGGFTGPTAWTLVDYKGLPGFRGKGRFTDAELQDLVDVSARRGWQLGLHAIGDAAIVQTVNAYSDAIRNVRGVAKDHRWFLDHFTVMPPTETMEIMARDRIFIAQQPNFLYNLEGRYAATLDDWRLRHNNSVGTPVHRYGLFVAFGSDNLPIGPMVGLYAAVSRKGPSGTIHGPEESVTMPEAIRMYTANGPWLTFEEKLKGTLEPGKLADLIVLDKDPLTVSVDDLLTTKVDLTVLGGKIVFDRLSHESTRAYP